MNDNARPVSALRPDTLREFPLWRYTGADEPHETWVQPLKSRRTSTLVGKLIGTEVTLADGTPRWALFGNIDPNDPRLTEHFLTMSLFVRNRWFHLARYHDFDARRRGPAALAASLRRPVGAVFPIAYDLRPYVRGDYPSLAGAITARPRERLSRSAIIALAVP